MPDSKSCFCYFQTSLKVTLSLFFQFILVDERKGSLSRCKAQRNYSNESSFVTIESCRFFSASDWLMKRFSGEKMSSHFFDDYLCSGKPQLIHGPLISLLWKVVALNIEHESLNKHKKSGPNINMQKTYERRIFASKMEENPDQDSDRIRR